MTPESLSFPPLPDGSTLSEDRSKQVLAEGMATCGISLIAVALRIWARVLTPNKRVGRWRFWGLWWDDYLVVLAFLTLIAMDINGSRLLAYGLGKHIQAVNPTPEEHSNFLRIMYGNQIIYAIGMTFVRSAAICFFHRVFDVSKSWYYRMLQVTHVVVWSWAVAVTLAAIFQCTPVEKDWQPWMEGRCLNLDSLWTGVAASGLVLDLWVSVLPMPKLWGLRLDAKKKMLLVAVFLIGYAVPIANIGDTVTIVQAGPLLEEDPYWNTVTHFLWVVISIPVGITTVCLPPSMILFKRIKQYGLTSIFRKEIRSYAIPLHDREERRIGNSSIVKSHSQGYRSRNEVNGTKNLYSVRVQNPRFRDEESAWGRIPTLPAGHGGIEVRHDFYVTR